MRGTIVKSPGARIAGFLVFLAAQSACEAQTLGSLFDRINPSVVKVDAPDIDNTATGFVWNQADHVVTSLHVVDGSRDIQVYYPTQQVSRRANVIKVLKDADLVLLRVDNAPTTPPLTHTSQIPSVDEEVHLLGFYLNVAAVNSFSFKLRYGSRVLRQNIPARVTSSIINNGYPDPDLQVLKLGQDNLLPGLSGSPIFNANGEVVGIADGGLEQGAINISWAVPADNLDRLLASSVATLPNSRGTDTLFAGERDLDLGPTVTSASGDITLVKVKTRSLAELMTSADDVVGLSALANYFYDLNPSAFEYDIYMDVESGATVAVPAGAMLSAGSDGYWTVDLLASSSFNYGDVGTLEAVLQIRKTDARNNAQQLSVDFERELLQRFPGLSWQTDPQWSYLGPYTRFDGLAVTRRAATGFTTNGFQFIPQMYSFETLATRNEVFAGLAILNHDNTPQFAMLRNQCAFGANLQDCPSVYQYRRAWAQLAIGVQLTTFSL